MLIGEFMANGAALTMVLAILTVFVFYIPACEHKMTYSSEYCLVTSILCVC